MVTTAQLEAFLERQKQLLAEERQAEIDQTSLLLSNCSPKLLEKKGLALLGLGVVNVNIGLGGKSFVELERPSAHHSSPLFPPHTFRPGDLARIEDASTSSDAVRKGGKSRDTSERGSTRGLDGVVYKVFACSYTQNRDVN
ncbi:hypothetical protein FRC14_004954 [Serendipita sp. 396]|nr:hypothetical protein FRC14_004954 [Serendipita sp. 396]KAG8862674.1 hypothetical protein FRC20_011107 [Serendipita sp. 405]